MQTNKVRRNSRYFVVVLNKTIIPLTLGYDMIMSKSYPRYTCGIIANTEELPITQPTPPLLHHEKQKEIKVFSPEK